MISNQRILKLILLTGAEMLSFELVVIVGILLVRAVLFEGRI
jgi:hypothetical protein